VKLIGSVPWRPPSGSVAASPLEPLSNQATIAASLLSVSRGSCNALIASR